MKRRDLIRQIMEDGCILIRHREIKEPLAQHILKMLSK
jgi:hypothetical protein